MNMNPTLNGHTLLIAGLAGIAGYEILLHTLATPALQSDLNHGLWIGAFLGLKLLGLFELSRARRGS